MVRRIWILSEIPVGLGLGMRLFGGVGVGLGVWTLAEGFLGLRVWVGFCLKAFSVRVLERFPVSRL
jgi:hypothetical protein